MTTCAWNGSVVLLMGREMSHDSALRSTGHFCTFQLFLFFQGRFGWCLQFDSAMFAAAVKGVIRDPVAWWISHQPPELGIVYWSPIWVTSNFCSVCGVRQSMNPRNGPYPSCPQFHAMYWSVPGTLELQKRIDYWDKNRLLKEMAKNFIIELLCCVN